jgi:lipase chaperone LimK
MRTAWKWWIAMAAAGLGVLGWLAAEQGEAPPAQAAVSAARPAIGRGAPNPTSDVPARAEVAPPVHLDTEAPRLAFDSAGRLQRDQRPRDLFDHMLAAVPQAEPLWLDRLVESEVSRQSGDRPARLEALDLWQRYRAYLAALAAAERATAVTPSAQPDVEALHSVLERRIALREQHLGEWSGPLFGEEQQLQLLDLARLRLARAAHLSEAAKANAIHALEQSLTPSQRALREHRRRDELALAQIGQALLLNGSGEDVRTRLAATLGNDIAQRAAEAHAAERTWQDRYMRYAAERDQLLLQQLSAKDRQVQLAGIRSRHFASEADAYRAASLDATVVPQE